MSTYQPAISFNKFRLRLKMKPKTPKPAPELTGLTFGQMQKKINKSLYRSSTASKWESELTHKKARGAGKAKKRAEKRV